MMEAARPGIIEVFAGGFTTFFSVWQLCIMQITPFYAAFSLGVCEVFSGGAGQGTPRRRLFLSLALLAIGFSLVFAIAGSPYLPNINTGAVRAACGVFVIAAGIFMAVPGFSVPAAYAAPAVALISGAAMAAVYSPCISPSLSDILNYARTEDGGRIGFVLLFSYAAGMTVALNLVTGVVTAALSIFREEEGRRRGTKAAFVFFGIFMILGVLLVTGFMRNYKAFLLNIF